MSGVRIGGKLLRFALDEQLFAVFNEPLVTMTEGLCGMLSQPL